MDFTYIPIILALFTIGAVLVFAFTRYRKMNKELPDDHEVHPEDKIASKTTVSEHKPTPQSAATHGTKPPEAPDQGTPPPR